MKVAMIGWEFPPFLAGGLGVHCLELTTDLARRGVDIDFYMPHMYMVEGEERVSGRYNHVTIHEVEADPITPYGPVRGGKRAYQENFNNAVYQYNQRLLDAFVSTDADVIHCHDWITADAAVTLAERTGIPLVFTIHSTEFDRSAGFYPQEWIIGIERHGVRSADAVIGVSRLTRRQLVERYGADPDRTFAVHNGVTHEGGVSAVDRDYGRDSQNVLFLSRVSRQKGPMAFLEAARRVAEVNPRAHFVVAGKGEMVPEMIERTITWGITDRVTFAGYIPDDMKARFYGESDVYVLPSVSEPFGISVLEAMSAGVPTVVSKSTGVAEDLTHVLKVDHWDTRLLANHIHRILESNALKSELGRNGALEARKFTWERCGGRTLDVYRAVAGRRHGEPIQEATAS